VSATEKMAGDWAPHWVSIKFKWCFSARSLSQDVLLDELRKKQSLKECVIVL